MSENIRKTAFAIGRIAQADLVTANAAAGMIRPTKLNASFSNLNLLSEDNAQDIGKDDEFASQNFLTNWDAGFQLEMLLTSEMAAHAFAFGLGSSVASVPGAPAYRHTAVPQSAGIDLVPFSFLEMLPSDGSVIDRVLIGCVTEGWTIQLNSGPGRQNAKITMDVVGTGNFTSPGGIVMPAAANMHFLNAGSATITILAQNYITLKRIISLEMGYRNNARLDTGFYPGSGTVSGAAIRGRMEHGDREAYLRAVVRLEATSTELSNLIAQTEGTAVVTLQGALITGAIYHDLSVTFHRVVVQAAPFADENGLVTVQVEFKVMKHSSNGLLTAYATNELALFGAEV